MKDQYPELTRSWAKRFDKGPKKLTFQEIRMLSEMDFILYSFGPCRFWRYTAKDLAERAHFDGDRGALDDMVIRLVLLGHIRVALFDYHRKILVFQRTNKGLLAVLAACAPAKCEWVSSG
jgi:hypothetical protein